MAAPVSRWADGAAQLIAAAVVRDDMEEERRAGGRARASRSRGKVGSVAYMGCLPMLQFHHLKELIVSLNTVTANSTFIFLHEMYLTLDPWELGRGKWQGPSTF